MANAFQAGKQFKKETAKKTGNDTVELDNSQLALALRRVWEVGITGSTSFNYSSLSQLNEDLKAQVEFNKLKADAEAAKKNSRAEAAQELHERQIRLIKIAGECVQPHDVVSTFSWQARMLPPLAQTARSPSLQ